MASTPDRSLKSGKYTLGTGVTVEHFDDRSLLLLGDTDQILTLNRVGGDLVEAILNEIQCEPFDADFLANLMIYRYALQPEQARCEATSILQQWTRYGIVEQHVVHHDVNSTGDSIE